MKLGQMISMDAGDMLPPELAEILATLRDRANFMPPRQLDKVLAEQWGKVWRKQFRRFEPRPIAAASIGQVHRALTRDGRTLAIKVQYPGVAQSIDSDVDNVATLLRVSGLLPKELDIAPLLTAAKEQLHEEADYEREGEQMRLYAARLADEPGFVVPQLDEELTREAHPGDELCRRRADRVAHRCAASGARCGVSSGCYDWSRANCSNSG